MQSPNPIAAAIDTATAPHRKLRFDNLEQMLSEVALLAAAERRGALQRTGNWSLGQALGHLAAWIDYEYRGFPAGLKASWFGRCYFRLFVKKRVLRDGIPPGIRLPGAPSGTYGSEAMTLEQGEARLREAVQRLQRGELPKFYDPMFGRVSETERLNIHLRHAELHLGFFFQAHR